MKKIIVAIDGHSSCGKSTMAKDLAREVGYIYVDTGAMYRAVTLFALRQGLFAPDGSVLADRLEALMPQVSVGFTLDPATRLPLVQLCGETVESEIRGLEVSSRVSPIAALPFVRRAMTEQQQLMGRQKGIVMDGRDIGTVVFPEAELKVFVTAFWRFIRSTLMGVPALAIFLVPTTTPSACGTMQPTELCSSTFARIWRVLE